MGRNYSESLFKMIKLVLSIRSLNLGGAERQFIELVKHIDKNKFDVYVCTMYGGVLEEEIKAVHDVHYTNLQKKGRYDLFSFFIKYRSYLASIQPDVIYSFLPEMNLFSLWCKPKKTKIVWGIRASNVNFRLYGKMPILLFWLQKIFLFKIHKIILNSHTAYQFYRQYGFNMCSAIVISNGIDTTKFHKDDQTRKIFREKYSLQENDIVIGTVARIDPMKGYLILANVALLLFQKYNNVYFFAIGSGNPLLQKEYEDIVKIFNNKKFFWLPEQINSEAFYSGFDIFCSPSLFGEGFSNAIAEAMSCEVPCVVTDVGDSKLIVGDCGLVVHPNNIQELEMMLIQMLTKDLKVYGSKSRSRIVENFSIKQMINKVEKEINELAK